MLAPTGDYMNMNSCIVHCVQLEPHGWASSILPSVGSGFIRQGDQLSAQSASFDLPLMIVADAVTADGTCSMQVLWQADDNTDDNRLLIGRDGNGMLRLERRSGGVTSEGIDLVSLQDGKSFGLALVIEPDLTVRWSVDGGAEQTGSLSAFGSYSNERIGCSVGLDENWGGFIWKLERWNDN